MATTSTGVVPPLKKFVKDPDSKLDYTVDWSKWLGSDTIAGSVWILDPDDGDLISSAPSVDTAQKRTTVWLEGGVIGEYKITNRVTTTAGRIVDRSFILVIAER